MIAFSVQRELEQYQEMMEKQGISWTPEDKSRPKGVLYIVDRSMDPMAPLLHEFTYQAMAHDLLPIQDGEKVTYKLMMKDSETSEMREMEISEDDKVWQSVR